MAKSTGKLKYDLALSTTSVYNTSSVYVNKSASLSINGNANLQYKTIGPTYSVNLGVLPDAVNLLPGPTAELGKAYLYVRNLGPSDAASLRLSTSTNQGNTALYDANQFADIAVNEFAFFPVVIGPSSSNIYVRSAFEAGSTYWSGATYNEIEYMIAYTTPNISGPTY
jgi:hypothetical protein